jgi:RNA polymerase sigma-70 factor (ECF subfamily)
MANVEGEPEAPTPHPPAPKKGTVTPLSLLERVRANDPEAWRRLVDLYQPLVRFWCCRAGASAEDAEDVAQEVFAAAAAGLGRFQRDRPGDTFRGWLRGITRNQVLMHFRRNQGRPQAEGGDEALARLEGVPSPPEGAVEDGAEDEAVAVSQLYRRAVEQVRSEFEERTWQAFWLTAIEARSPDALAAELGMTAAGIRQAKSRVLRRIKREVGDLLE